MNIHEYQAKQLFEQYGIPVPKGYAGRSFEEFDQILETFPAGPVVVKSQIHAGGRGKGIFADGYKGGVRVCTNRMAARDSARCMLRNWLITPQTGSQGRRVMTVYFMEARKIAKEFYLAITLDRQTSKPVIIASTEGGVDIETVAREKPDKIVKIWIEPTLGLRPYQAREVAYAFGFDEDKVKQMVKLLNGLWKLFWEKDASLVEINPLITTVEGKIEALDAKVTFDDNALFRHPDVVAMRDLNEEDPKEIEASKFNLNYVALDGNIACMVNGAGLAMATMDIIQYYGGKPANFLDVGGGATEDQVTAAFKIILSDENVKGILVNIFGGIMKCDIIAKGVIAAAKNVDMKVPLVVRLEGTNVELGKKLLAESGLAITAADSLADAAQKIVKLAGPAPAQAAAPHHA